MKKTLLIVLALVLVLTMAVGCGSRNAPDGSSNEPLNVGIGGPGSGSGGNDSGRGDSGAEGWPAAKLPQGFPAYPNGVVIQADEDDDLGLIIVISETDEATHGAYLKTLEAAGWTIPDWYQTTGTDVAMEKDNYRLMIDFYDTYIFDEESGDLIDSVDVHMIIGAHEYSTDLGYEWPTDLPFDLPAYPEGEIMQVRMTDDGGVSITIGKTSRATFDRYKDMMTNEGWIYTETDEMEGLAVNWFDSKDGLWVCAVDWTGSDTISIRVIIPAG